MQYVGITNDLARRAGEHAGRFAIEEIPGLTNLSRADAKAVEQVLIETPGLAGNGGTLLNKINSIASTNPGYAQALQRGANPATSWLFQMSAMTKIKVGDCFRIPLRDGRSAYCQYIQQNGDLGYLIRVFDRITTEPQNTVEGLEAAESLFPPVFVGLRASVRSGRWQKIGTLPVLNFEFPKFRLSMGTKPGTYHDWRIWDGKTTVSIGDLPEHLRSLELKQVWGDEGLEERIVAGAYRGDRMF